MMADKVTRKREIRRLTVLLAGRVLLVGVLVLTVVVGAVSIPLPDLWLALRAPGTTEDYRIIYTLRMPRGICAALAGANLALSGCILQGVLRNPLADPGIIGISAGAGLAAMALMMLAPTLTVWVPLAAFAGALGAAAIVFFLAWERGVNPLRLVLAGVAVAAFFGGGMTALSVFFSDKVQGTVSWMAGGFAGAGWPSVRMILPYSLIGMIVTVCLYRRLNALQLGDDVAQTLGVQVNRTRALLVALAALLAASAVSVAGLLGFVGLVVPHVMRLIVGSDFEPLLPCSAVFGAVLVAGADVAARTVFSPMEVPVGIFMSFIGAPFFLYLLRRRLGTP